MITQQAPVKAPVLLKSAADRILHTPEQDQFWYFKGDEDIAHAIWTPIEGGKFWLIVFPGMSTNSEQVAAIARSMDQATDVATQRTMRRAIASFCFYDDQGDERFAETVPLLVPNWDIRYDYAKLRQSCQDWATFLSKQYQGWCCDGVRWIDEAPFDEF